MIPQAFVLIGLCAVLYAGVWINAYLLNWEIPLSINALIAAIILVLIILELILKYLKLKKYRAELYVDRLIIKTPKNESLVMLATVGDPIVERNAMDKIFRTGTIQIGGNPIRFTKKPDEMSEYLNQARKYAQYYAAYAQRQANG